MMQESGVRPATEPRRVETSSQRSLRAALNPVMGGIASAGIYVLIAVPVDLAFTAYRIGGWTSLMSQIGVPETLGKISAQFTLLVIMVSVLAFLRKYAGTVHSVFLDWKWWTIALVMFVLPSRPIVNWVGASLIYQYRERRQRVARHPIASISKENQRL